MNRGTAWQIARSLTILLSPAVGDRNAHRTEPNRHQRPLRSQSANSGINHTNRDYKAADWIPAIR